MNEFRDKLRVQGVKASGYGIIPKLVMLDRKLTIEAKSIYAYFCSYAGAGDTAFPTRDKICEDLGIGTKRYYNHFKLLVDLGYIEVEQTRHNGGKFKHNIYTLTDKPTPITKEQESKNVENKPSQPRGHQGYTAGACTDNDYNNINSLYNINSSLYNHHSFTKEEKENERVSDPIDKNDFNDILINSNAYDVEEEFMIAIPRAIRNLYYTDKPLRLNDILTSPEHIREDLKLLRWKHIDLAIRSFKKESEQQELRNPIAYLSICIYNSIFDSEIKLNSELRFNGHI